ncbi:thiol-disulfide isomerase/thioredoxin [Chitinophaga skermanii]|uniref:Thiol-disulfide isomerase/thioredoxin n=1 Tax=Chitinophaga skermanii TaxID=331697 RepID=A0A327R4R1_9BACT|nr:TlpA disulfide reductase family protein [Chitinophaga skermanii]RAJ08877.1 thiol-disulfide isomerase/thioredoxin [Chitinophaga skermanii]
MKKLIQLVFLLTCAFASKAQVTYLDVHEKVSTYPKVEWVRGTPVTQFDKNKIYIIELWATWCKPCIKSMPHMNQLYTKYKDRIEFIGQDVWEDDIEKVKQFLVDNKDIISYPIAYAGKREESDFEKNWIKPSGTVGIPRTFIVQNNTIMWITNPFSLYEEHLQLLLENKFTEEAAEAIVKKHKL